MLATLSGLSGGLFMQNGGGGLFMQNIGGGLWRTFSAQDSVVVGGEVHQCQKTCASKGILEWLLFALEWVVVEQTSGSNGQF